MGGLVEGGRKRGHLPGYLLVFPSGLSTGGNVSVVVWTVRHEYRVTAEGGM